VRLAWEGPVVRQLVRAMDSGRRLYGRKIESAFDFFAAIDRDDSGAIDSAEFTDAARRLDFGLEVEQLDLLFRNMDYDGSGALNYAEFITELFRFGEEGIAEQPWVRFEDAGFVVTHRSYMADIAHRQAMQHMRKKKRRYPSRVLVFDDTVHDGPLGLTFAGLRHPFALLRPQLSDACTVRLRLNLCAQQLSTVRNALRQNPGLCSAGGLY
jgi:hypothetical protein